VLDATFGVLRRLDLRTIFSTPGAAEVPFLAGLPDGCAFVLGLHEGSAVAMAAGHALARGAPPLVLLHALPGLANAVAALAAARAARAPLVVLAGQQDRRHLAQEPFLSGRLEGLAGDHPVWSAAPVRAQDVPGAVVRAHHEAMTHRGPALVVVPMDDWLAPAPAPHEVLGPRRVIRSEAADPVAVEELAELVDTSASPVLVAGAGAAGLPAWAALLALSERLGCPVWQEPFGAAAGFPQDHPRFAGHLPARRAGVRDALAGHDVVLVAGTALLRQHPYEDGPLVAPGTRVAVVSQDPAEVHRSPADLGVVGSPAAICLALADAVAARPRQSNGTHRPPPALEPPAPGEPLRAAHVLAALAERLPPHAVVVEETPSSRRELHARVPVMTPGGFFSAMGMLGFGLPAAVGLRLGDPARPVIAVLGDGAALHQVMGLWSAARHGAGVLFVVLATAGHAAAEIDIAALARAQGVEAVRVTGLAALHARLDEVLPALAARSTPLVLEVAVAPGEPFDPWRAAQGCCRNGPRIAYT